MLRAQHLTVVVCVALVLAFPDRAIVDLRAQSPAPGDELIGLWAGEIAFVPPCTAS